MSEMRDRFVAAVQPLAGLVEELDAEVLRLEAELSELRELRRNVKTVLRTLNPQPKALKPKPRDNTKRAEVSRQRAAQERLAKKQRVLEYLRGYSIKQDITVEAVQSNGLGDPPISRGMLYELLKELRDDGYLRLDRTGAGGQAIYRVVSL